MSKIKQLLYCFFPALELRRQEPKEHGSVFFVDHDLSLSLNYESETVKEAFRKNIDTLQRIRNHE